MKTLLDRVKQLDKNYRLFNTITHENKPTKIGLLEGYAVSVKDNICVKNMVSTAGSKILEGYTPPFDATVISKCREEGAYIIGKTTQDEFGFGTFNVNTEKIPLNPHDQERSTGGSSGGAAALTAVADFPHLAISESTGGSISSSCSFSSITFPIQSTYIWWAPYLISFSATGDSRALCPRWSWKWRMKTTRMRNRPGE